MRVRKDPDAKLDYGVDWSNWLDGDTITTSSWTIMPDDGTLTITSTVQEDTATTVWLSDGEPGKRYKVRNRINTAEGRVDDRTIIIKIQNK